MPHLKFWSSCSLKVSIQQLWIELGEFSILVLENRPWQGDEQPETRGQASSAAQQCKLPAPTRASARAAPHWCANYKSTSVSYCKTEMLIALKQPEPLEKWGQLCGKLQEISGMPARASIKKAMRQAMLQQFELPDHWTKPCWERLTFCH